MGSRDFDIQQFIIAALGNLQGDDVEEIESVAAAILAKNKQWDTLELNVPLNGAIEERIFDALLSSDTIKRVIIPPNLEVSSSLEHMLRKAILKMPNLSCIAIASPLTESQAERIFSILRMSSLLEEITLHFGDFTDGIAKPLASYLRESPSPLEKFGCTWEKYDENMESTMSQAALRTIWEGISESRSLKGFAVFIPPVSSDLDVVAECIATAMAKSSSLELCLFDIEHARTLAVKVEHSLMSMDPIKNFDLCFCIHEGERFRELILNRNAPWKPLLSQTVRLALWPRILAKTNAWKDEASHSPLDALYFLLCEKNDVLLQNVRRRKIRKRKRFQIA